MSNIKKFWYFISQKKLTIGNAAVILALTGLISNILGLFRERLIAGFFGAGNLTDAFFASFRLPDMIFNFLILGALSSAFIPVFVSKLTEEKEDDARIIASSFMNFILITAIVFGIIIFILAPQLVPIFLLGFFNRANPVSPELYHTTVNLTRLLILSPIFFSVSAVFGGILNSYKRFVAYAIAPLIYNLSIIFSVLFLTKYFAQPIYALTVGVIGGAFLHALVQLPSVRATGYRWRPIIDFKRGEIAKIIKLMLPRALAIGIGQINLFVDITIASFFIGGITVINFANDIQTAPTVIFGIAIATAIFPVLSESAAKNDLIEFMKDFSWSARRILFFMIPATAGIIILRAQIIRLVFGVGNFTWDNTYWTTKALLFFAIGLIAQALVPLLIRAFYALQDTKTPLVISIIVVAINAFLSITLPFYKSLGLGVAGIALAFSIAGIVNAILLFIALHNKIGALDSDHKIFESTARLILATFGMSIVVYGSLYFFDTFVQTETVTGLLFQTLGAGALGALTYFGLAYIFKCEEMKLIFNRSTKTNDVN